MSLIKFLSSKTFLKQLGLAVVAIVVLSFILLKWLNISTNHGDFQTVPNLTGKSISVAQIELEQNNLELKIKKLRYFKKEILIKKFNFILF